MAERIPERLWLAQAQGLLPGADDKIIHMGCGDRPSMFIKNDDDKYWAYCHRCRGTGFKDKQVPRIKQKLATKTGWKPEKLMPLVHAIVDEPYNFRDLLSRFNLAPYITLLKFSPDTMRVYFPDDSESYLGLDATFKANARFYSPVKRNMCKRIKNRSGNLYLTSHLDVYLEHCANSHDVILVMNRRAEVSALAEVSRIGGEYENVVLGKSLRKEFRQDLYPFI